jgi:3-(3-hydroxy-phenyl)propionate hydroxylase
MSDPHSGLHSEHGARHGEHPCPNAVLGDGRRLDDVAAGRFALVTVEPPTAAQRLDVDRRGGVVVHAAPGTDLGEWLRRGRAKAAVVRPDGTVLRAGRDPSALGTAVPSSARPADRRDRPATPSEGEHRA